MRESISTHCHVNHLARTESFWVFSHSNNKKVSHLNINFESTAKWPAVFRDGLKRMKANYSVKNVFLTTVSETGTSVKKYSSKPTIYHLQSKIPSIFSQNGRSSEKLYLAIIPQARVGYITIIPFAHVGYEVIKQPTSTTIPGS